MHKKKEIKTNWINKKEQLKTGTIFICAIDCTVDTQEVW